jgi:hypothetical protein
MRIAESRRRRAAHPRTGLPLVAALVSLAVLVVVLLLVLVLVVVRDDSEPSDQAVVPPEVVAGEPLTGEEYAVSPQGDDDAVGTADRPWRTLEHALGQLRPGDRLTVGDGTYDENIVLDVREADEDAPIQVVAAEDARPVVVGLLWLADLSWWDIRGINVTWDDDNDADEHMVKLTDGVGWRFADAEIWGARSYAALLVDGEPEDFTLSGLYVHDTYPSNDTNQDHLIYLNCGTGGGVVERSILAHSDNGRALKIGSADEDGDEVANIVVRYVTMVDNRGPSNVQLAYDTSDVLIERSILVGSAPGRTNVTAFDLAGEGSVVRDSLGWESSGMVDGTSGLEDAGGNVRFNPRLSGPDGSRPYYPADERAQAFGRWADDTDE